LGQFHEHKRRELWSRDRTCDSALQTMSNEVGNLINQYDIYVPCLSGAGLDCSNYTKVIIYM
jgi:hypothetical protein